MKKLIINLKKKLNKIINKTLIEKKDVELIQNKKEMDAYNRALDEFKNGETVSINEYLKTRDINE